MLGERQSSSFFCRRAVLSILSLLVLCCILSSAPSVFVAAATNDDNDNDDDDAGFGQLVVWMTQQGGRVHPNIQVGVRHGIRGIVSKQTLQEGDEVLYCPWKLVLGSTSLEDKMTKHSDRMCHVVHDMAREIKLGVDSLWFPYLTHIELPRLPAIWEDSALEELQGLGPTQDATRHLQWFQQACASSSTETGGGGSDVSSLDPSIMRSLVSFISRASEVGMIPIYDLLNHHNGKRNAKLTIEQDGVHLNVVGGDIPKGEQLYLSYGVKSAATMFRDYGFVEEWPVIYNFLDATSGDNFAFVVLAEDSDNANSNATQVAINPTSQFLEGLWRSNMPLSDYQATARQHMESLSREEWLRFARAAQRRLEAFPTTWHQDTNILADKTKQLNETLATNIDDDIIRSNLQDILGAIQYRRAFKQALEKAATSCEAMLAQRSRATTKQEL